MIDKNIADFDLQMQGRIATYVQQKIDEQRDTVGTILAGAQASLADLDKRSAALIAKAVDSESRVSSMLVAINQMDDAQSRVSAFATELEQKTSKTINDIVDSFNLTLHTQE